MPDEMHVAEHPAQANLFSAPNAFAYPSHQPTHQSTYPSQSNPSSFTNFTDSNGIMRTFQQDGHGHSHGQAVQENADAFAGYARSHGFQPDHMAGQYDAYRTISA